jgi:phenylacetate-CoA ligase
MYEVIGTGFNNYAMPLIRYRTGDSLELETEKGCGCGRNFPLVKHIHGRHDDYIKLPDGRVIGRLDHIFKGMDQVVEGQVVQDQPGRVDILVVPTSNFSSIDERALVHTMRDRVGDQLEIAVRQVSSLTRTRNGKVRNVICTI